MRHTKTIMPRTRSVSIRQLDELLRLLEINKDIANGRIVGGALGHQRAIRFWQDVATSLNCIPDGIEKSGERWKAYWHDLKYRAKKKAAEVRVHAAGTGGGPSGRGLNETDLKILSIMGSVAYEGHPTVQIPLQIDEQTPQQPPPDSAHAAVVEAPPPPVHPVAPSPPPVIQAEEEEELEEFGQRTLGRTPRRVSSINRPRNRISADPPLWARQYEERRLAVDSQRAQAQARIADVLEMMQPILARILHLLGERLNP